MVHHNIDREEAELINTARDQYLSEYQIRQAPQDRRPSPPFSTVSSFVIDEPTPHIANSSSNDTTKILASIAELCAAISIATDIIIKQHISIQHEQRKLDNLWGELSLLVHAVQHQNSTL
jgi:hypothetical protein